MLNEKQEKILRRTMKCIRNSDDLRQVLSALCMDLAEAQDHFTLYRRLLEAKEGPFVEALSQSQTFWSLTYRAHLDAATALLCRAYDQGLDALNLRSFLGFLQTNPDILPVPRDGRGFSLDESLRFVTATENPVVRNLMQWRHRVFAHRDADETISTSLAETYPVTYDDISLLIDQGFKIINSVNVRYFNTSMMPKMTGSEDYLGVLKAIQKQVDEWKIAFQAEVERAKAQEDQ